MELVFAVFVGDEASDGNELSLTVFLAFASFGPTASGQSQAASHLVHVNQFHLVAVQDVTILSLTEWKDAATELIRLAACLPVY